MPLMAHQERASRRMVAGTPMALFHEMGTGKTRTVVHAASDLYAGDEDFDRILIICPTSVKPVWADEWRKWASAAAVEDASICVLRAGKAPSFNDKPLRILVVGVEALSQGKAFDYAEEFLSSPRSNTMCVIDESTTIKNWKARRTKRVLKLGKMATYRAILNGTPITQGVEDLYSQFAFLSSDILRCSSFYSFRGRYCRMGGFEGKKIVGYQNLDELLDRVKDNADIVRSADVLDLPEKVYERRYVTLTADQKRLIAQLETGAKAEHDGETLTVQMALDLGLRIQQIIGGHFTVVGNEEDGTPTRAVPLDGNPKLDELMATLDELAADRQVVIWARFVPEVEAICDRLTEQGISHCAFYGAVSEDEREQRVRDFQAGKYRVFVANQATGGIGLTLTAGTAMIYYSNTFSLYNRLQSEARCHRKGQTNTVLVIDLIADIDYDSAIIEAVEAKGDIAESVVKALGSRTKIDPDLMGRSAHKLKRA